MKRNIFSSIQLLLTAHRNLQELLYSNCSQVVSKSTWVSEGKKKKSNLSVNKFSFAWNIIVRPLVFVMTLMSLSAKIVIVSYKHIKFLLVFYERKVEYQIQGNFCTKEIECFSGISSPDKIKMNRFSVYLPSCNKSGW